MKRFNLLASVLSLLILGYLFSPLLADNQQKVTMRVDGLACPFCAYGLEKKIQKIEGVEKLDIKINDGTVIIYFKEGAKIDTDLIKKKVKEAGFTPREIKTESETMTSQANSHELIMSIEGMSCEACVQKVEKALQSVGCAKNISVDLEKKQATLECQGDEAHQKKLVEAVEAAGFKARLIKSENK